jgi:hypothetical protein
MPRSPPSARLPGSAVDRDGVIATVRPVAAGTGRGLRAGLVGRRAQWPVAVLIGAFALSRVAAAAAGVRFDDSVLKGTFLTDKWQLLDVGLLKHDLATSVWHLNSQPPLLNLYAGILEKVPTGLQRPIEVASALALGLVIVLCTYGLLVELRVPPVAAMVVTLVGVVASPAYLLFENWLDYAYPTAALGVFAAWCLIRYLRSGRVWPGLGFFGAYAAIVLLNSTYQIEWMLVALVVVVIVLRRQWRRVLAVAAVPLVVVLSWYVKDAVLFGTTTTSSWLGMNVARLVLFKAPPSVVTQLEHQGTLTPLASVPSFGAPRTYVPTFVRPTASSVAALGTLYKKDGATNFNNPIYITLSSQYLRDDIAYIMARPSEYVGDVSSSVQVWLVPSDQNFTNSLNWPHVRGYADIYDKAVEWQPVVDPAAAEVVFESTPSPLSWLSLQAIAVYALTLIGTPILLWRRRRVDAAFAGTLAVLWWTTVYAFAASSLVELGENERFRFELGPVPLILATVVATALVRAWWNRRPARQVPVDHAQRPERDMRPRTVVPSAP